MDSVSAFLAAMDSFGAASGQRLNLSKTKVMLLTDPPASHPGPTAIAGLQVVSQATILGIPFVCHDSSGQSAGSCGRLDSARG